MTHQPLNSDKYSWKYTNLNVEARFQEGIFWLSLGDQFLQKSDETYVHLSEFSEILEVIKKVDLLSFVNSVQKDQARIAKHLSSMEEKQSKFESHIKKAVDDQLIIMDNKLTEHLNKIQVKDQSDQDKQSLFRLIKSFEAQIDLLNKEIDDKNATISKLSKADSSLHLKKYKRRQFYGKPANETGELCYDE